MRSTCIPWKKVHALPEKQQVLTYACQPHQQSHQQTRGWCSVDPPAPTAGAIQHSTEALLLAAHEGRYLVPRVQHPCNTKTTPSNIKPAHQAPGTAPASRAAYTAQHSTGQDTSAEQPHRWRHMPPAPHLSSLRVYVHRCMHSKQEPAARLSEGHAAALAPMCGVCTQLYVVVLRPQLHISTGATCRGGCSPGQTHTKAPRTALGPRNQNPATTRAMRGGGWEGSVHSAAFPTAALA